MFILPEETEKEEEEKKKLCVGQDGKQMHTTLNLHLVSVNDCIALCIKSQPKPEFARRSTCCSHEMVMWPAFTVWAQSS